MIDFLLSLVIQTNIQKDAIYSKKKHKTILYAILLLESKLNYLL